MVLPFWKMQSVGNDFVLIHADDLASGLEMDHLSALAQYMCEHRYSIGADGLLVTRRHGAGVHLRMFNPDGTEDFCGNGIRCAAIHAFQQGWCGRQLQIVHVGQEIAVTVLDDGRIRHSLHPGSFHPSRVPLEVDVAEIAEATLTIDGESFCASALTTGSTHVVLFVGALPEDEWFRRISPQIEHHRWFPEQTSVIWCEEIEPGNLVIRIWERGVGETLGCGTGSAAAAVAWSRRTGLSGSIEVRNPGGPVAVEMSSWDGPLTLEAPAHEVFSGVATIPEALLSGRTRGTSSLPGS